MMIKLDLTSIEEFWNIFEMLQSSQNPSEDEWNKLFNTLGYRTLIENEFNKDFFRQSFQTAFNPEFQEIYEKLLEGKTRRYLKYYAEIKESKKTYQKNIKMIKDRWESISETIYTRASAFLPYVEFESNLVISIIIFDRDARGYDSIVIDPIFTNRMEDFVSLTAHEVHHYYRNQLLQYNKEDVKKEHKDLLWLLNQIHSEGIADQIDKDYFIFGGIKTSFPESYVRYFKQYVKESTRSIEEINAVFKKFENKDINQSELGLNLKKIVPLAGHPLGYFMVNLIIRNSLFEELIKGLGNPFSFFKLYNNAVLKDKEEFPLFSNYCLQFISELEKIYVTSR